MQSLACGGLVNAIAFSSDGEQVATGGDSCCVEIWRIGAAPGNARLFILETTATIWCVALCPTDSRIVAAGLSTNFIQVWNTGTDSSKGVLTGHAGCITSVVFSPRSNPPVLASASSDQTVRIWCLATNVCLCVLRGHSDWVRSVAFSPNGRYIATGSNDQTVRIWQAMGPAMGSSRAVLAVGGICRSAVFSPDGYVVAAGAGSTTQLLLASTGRLLCTLHGHIALVRSVAFSSSGSIVVTSSCDGTARLWHASGTNTGDSICTLTGYGVWIYASALSPSGSVLAVASEEYTVRLWNISTFSCEARILVLALAEHRVQSLCPQRTRPRLPNELWRMIASEF